jgi:hypothetical protein
LSRQPTNHLARAQRALASLQAGQFDAARQDYEILAREALPAYPALFGLADVAYRTHQQTDAVRFCYLYLSNAPPNALGRATVRQWLKELRP